MTINDPKFLKNGYCFHTLDLPQEIDQWVHEENWVALDQWLALHTQKEGMIGKIISSYLEAYSIEHIISLRTDPDEDGIWHDDGSRDLAFSLSLNKFPKEIQGGHLAMRQRNSAGEEKQIETQNWGTIILFLTGKQGFEHKTCAVIKGKRLVAAGWATERSS